MAYHWGQERRRGTDRRVPRHAPYAGLERRATDRRQHLPEKKSKLGWVVIALVAFLMLDHLVWDGYYFHGFMVQLRDTAAATRAWSDDVWHFR